MLHDAIVHKLFMGNGEKVGIVTILSKKGDDDSDNELAGLTNRIKYFVTRSENNMNDKLKTVQNEIQTEVAGVKSEIKAVKTDIKAVESKMDQVLDLLKAKK